MKTILAAAVGVLAIALALFVVALEGRYQIVGAGDDVYRLDRWTGTVALCGQWSPGDALACVSASDLEATPPWASEAPKTKS